MDAARRQFLRGGFLTGQGRAQIDRLENPLGPSPPWHQDRLKTEICSACEHPCVTACEADIIRLHPTGHRLASLPYLCFDEGGCTFCGACVAACPMDLGEERKNAQVRIGTAVLQRAACLAWEGVVCMSCKFACTPRAIQTDDRNRPSICKDTCTGCGMCVTVCPNQAITITESRSLSDLSDRSDGTRA